jgi:hypothetical protein
VNGITYHSRAADRRDHSRRPCRPVT